MIRNGSVISLCLAVAALLVAPNLHAQRLSAISGVIVDPSGARVPAAAITLVHQDSGFRRSAESGPEGEYSVSSLYPGVYKVTVRKEGFRTMIRFGVRAEAATNVRVDFSLAVGSTQEVLTVESTAIPTSLAEPAVVGHADHDEIERLPVNGGGVSSLLDLTPGLLVTPATRGEAGQYSAGGQRPNSNYFTVDGVSANSGVIAGGSPARPSGGSLPGYSAIGSLHSMIPVEALEEMTVRTSSAGSEFGRLPGAQVTLQSRSGTNELHGSVVYFFRHERLAANDWFANTHNQGRAPLRVNDFAASLGGPAIRNRTFFFAAYEGIRLRQPFAWSTPVPSTAFRVSAPQWMQPLLASYPIPNGNDLGRGLAEWTGRNKRPSSLDSGTIRVDHSVSSRVTLFARYNDSPSDSEFGNTLTNSLSIRAQSLTGSASVQTSAWLFDSRVNASRVHATSAWNDSCSLAPVITKLSPPNDACANLLRFSIAGTPQLSFGREGTREQGQFQFVQSARLERADHSLRMGIDYRNLRPQRHDSGGTLSFIADSIESLSIDRNLWKAQATAIRGETTLDEISLYLHDTWRIRPGLTATLGVRWEINPPPAVNGSANFLDLQRSEIVPAARSLWMTDWTNVAPRGGIAWRTAKRGPIVRVSAGIYYDSSLSLATDIVNGGPFSSEEFVNNVSAPFSSTVLRYAFMPNLKLPVVTQWSTSVEQGIGGAGTFSTTYLGSTGTRLIRREVSGEGSKEREWYALATNRGSSEYHALQLQFAHRLSNRWQARAGYTWAHSIDDSSSDASLHWVRGLIPPGADRGSSDFDVRHLFSASAGYEYKGWSLDSILRARSGFPISVLNTDHYLGVSLSNAFRPNLINANAVWIDDALAPGGRRLNPSAFQVLDGVQGNLGRNAFTGFGMWQIDVALRREFRFTDRRRIELRVEGFNITNHPNFADPTRYLINPLFGRSGSMLNLMLGTGTPGSGLAPVYQAGGPRSLQVAMRWKF